MVALPTRDDAATVAENFCCPGDPRHEIYLLNMSGLTKMGPPPLYINNPRSMIYML